MTAGRPTDYTPEIVAKAWAYANGEWKEHGDLVPSVAGLASYIGMSRVTCYDWAKDENKQFSYILEKIGTEQERDLITGGLSGKFNAPISKMMMAKHGYSDRIETDHTSSDGTMTPKAVDLSKLPSEVLEALVEAADGQADD